jgi:transcriptional regulator with XRE-family HTH domain
MERLSPAALGQKVARKRGSMGIRAAAGEIGISAATLSRVERGHLPDSRTLGKICVWVGVDPAAVIGGAPAERTLPAVQMAFKQWQTFSAKTAKSLANLIITAHNQFLEQLKSEEN